MPESEPKPKLIELVAPGAGQGWKAVLKSGKAVVIHEIPVPPAEATAAIPRLQRLADHKHPALSPVLAWGTDPNGIWVAVEPNEGTPLATMLSRGPLTPPAAAALGAAVLSGVAALHEAGIAMGGFGASAIRVTANGDVRLAGHPAAAVRGAPAQSDLRADVRSCGMAVCAAFGVDPAGAPAPPNIPPGLVVTMRSMASGAMGPAADRAQNALREMASALLAPDRQVAAQSELALRAGGRDTPGVTPFLPGQAPAAAAPVPIPIPVPPPAPAPAPFVPQLRDETPVRAPVSYDAPIRATETYPGIPAPTFPPPTPPAPVPTPAPEIPAPRPIPTWSDAPPRTPVPEAPVAPAAVTPPAPAPIAPDVTRSPFDTAVPAAAAGSNPPATAPPAPAPTPQPFAAPVPIPIPAAPAPPPPAAPVQETWTPVETPAWKPPETTVPPPATEWTGTPTPVPPVSTASTAPRAATPVPVPVAPPPAFPRAPAPTPARQPTVARSRPPSSPSNRPSWLIPAIIAVVLILLLGTVGGIILANRGKTSTGPTATASPTAKTSPKPTASPTATATATPTPGSGPRAVPNFGPAAADPVTKVMFCSTATPCSLGSGTPPETATACDLNSCTVEVAIYFSAPQKTPVQYSLKFFNRCTGVTTDVPGPNAYTPPGYVVVIPTDKWRVNIPSGTKSGALVAVSSQPTVAASAPLLLGSDTSCA